MSCDLLEKSYFCSIANNRQEQGLQELFVVICLKNRTFAVSQTTRLLIIFNFGQLWFAWKIVLLQYRKQPESAITQTQLVVICLKNRTFAVSQTTLGLSIARYWKLWFAWKIVLLQYRKQLVILSAAFWLRCDLLEKSYFCSIANNCVTSPTWMLLVVICLKNRTFAVSQTTFVKLFQIW